MVKTQRRYSRQDAKRHVAQCPFFRGQDCGGNGLDRQVSSTGTGTWQANLQPTRGGAVDLQTKPDPKATQSVAGEHENGWWAMHQQVRGARRPLGRSAQCGYSTDLRCTWAKSKARSRHVRDLQFCGSRFFALVGKVGDLARNSSAPVAPQAAADRVRKASTRIRSGEAGVDDKSSSSVINHSGRYMENSLSRETAKNDLEMRLSFNIVAARGSVATQAVKAWHQQVRPGPNLFRASAVKHSQHSKSGLAVVPSWNGHTACA